VPPRGDHAPQWVPFGASGPDWCDASVVVAPTDANDDKEHRWRELSPQLSSGIEVCTIEQPAMTGPGWLFLRSVFVTFGGETDRYQDEIGRGD
jgi:hypothetical protein